MEGHTQERLWRCLPLRPTPEHEAVAVFGSLIACVSQAKASVRRNNGEAIVISDCFEEEQLQRLRRLRKQVGWLKVYFMLGYGGVETGYALRRVGLV